MLGREDDQKSLWDADTQYMDFVEDNGGGSSFYSWLAEHRRELFDDEDFADLYCDDNGRPSVPPSRLATALLLQIHDRVSDAIAADMALFDIRWKVALGIQMDEKPFAKSTLQLFRAQLMLHGKAEELLQRTIAYAKAHGFCKKRGPKASVAVDTTPILGRGAVEDTYNLIAEGISRVCRLLAEMDDEDVEDWADDRQLGRYFAASIKGTAQIDWDDESERQEFLTGLIEDGERVLQLAGKYRQRLQPGSDEDKQLLDVTELLRDLLIQDIEPIDDGYKIKNGTAKDRIPSAHDPQQRHGRKSQGHTFTGHKGEVAVDRDTGLIVNVDVIAGNASDGDSAADLIEGAEANSGWEVEQVTGDSAYGATPVRKALGKREVIAPTIKNNQKGDFSKHHFDIDLENNRVTCPAGKVTRDFGWRNRKRKDGTQTRVKRFVFAKETCLACPHYDDCVGGKHPRGRSITLHPDEEILQEARELEQTEYFDQEYKKRLIVEHRIARLMQLGMRQSRYFGRQKTRFQLRLTAVVANLTLVANNDDNDAGSEACLPPFLCFLTVQLAYAALRRHHSSSHAIPQALMRD